MTDLSPAVWAALLAELDRMSPIRLRALLARWQPVDAWAAVIDASPAEIARTVGADGSLARVWREAARRVDPLQRWEDYERVEVGVRLVDTAGPAELADDLDPPVVLFHAGELDLLAGPRVGIVGTRRCTRYGREVAFELGQTLAAEGVRVVSGLAKGVDAAAHEGALRAEAAPPIGVVGSGLDVVYPRSNRWLWAAVKDRGVLMSETPLGGEPLPWRFPARNRIIAALADVLVVVESNEKGGSLITASEAAQRGRPVMAVPGPIRARASLGTNRLLADGAAPACDIDDVLVALGLGGGARRGLAERTAPSARAAEVLDTIGWQPVAFDELVDRMDVPMAELAVTVELLVSSGWLVHNGSWLERSVAPVEWLPHVNP